MKKTIFCILLILMFFVAKDNSIFAQNKFKIGSISLSDTIIGGLHYLKINAGIRPITIFNESDTNRIGDIILKDSLGNLVIGANTIINGSLKFTNTDLTLDDINVTQINFGDSLQMYKVPFSDMLTPNRLIINSTYFNSSMLISLLGADVNNIFKVKIGTGSDTASLTLDNKNLDLKFLGNKFYVNGSIINPLDIVHKNDTNTFYGLNTFMDNLYARNDVTVGTPPSPANILVYGNIEIQGGNIDAPTINLNGVDINTTGTLTNVAYKNLANTFTLPQTFDTSASFNRSVSFAIDSVGDGVSEYIMTSLNNMLIVSLAIDPITVILSADRNGVEYIISLVATSGGTVIVQPIDGDIINGMESDLLDTINETKTYVYRNNVWYIKSN